MNVKTIGIDLAKEVFQVHRSMTTARYSQPSSVRKYVMSPAHFWFGPPA